MNITEILDLNNQSINQSINSSYYNIYQKSDLQQLLKSQT
jgi:hypothetical protein